MKTKSIFLALVLSILTLISFSFLSVKAANQPAAIGEVPQPKIYQKLSDIPQEDVSQENKTNINTLVSPILSLRIKDLNLEKESFKAGETIKFNFKLENITNYYGEGIYTQLTLHKNTVEESGAISINQNNIYDLVRNIEAIGLKPQEEKVSSFSYVIPANLPNGEYNLNLSVFSSREMNLDSFIKKITITDSKENFSFADPKNTSVIAEDKIYRSQEGAIFEYDKEYLPFGEKTYLKNIAKATATFNKPLPEGAVLKSKIYRYGEPLSELKEGSKVGLEKNGNVISFSLPLFSQPGAYEAIAQFYQGEEKISSPIRMRYIISGDSGLIYNFLVEKKDNQNFVLYLQNTSSADDPIGETEEKSQQEKLAKEQAGKDNANEKNEEENKEPKKADAQIIFEAKEKSTGKVCFQKTLDVNSKGDVKQVPFVLGESCSDDLAFSAKLMKDGKQLDDVQLSISDSQKGKGTSDLDSYFGKAGKILAIALLLAVGIIVILYLLKKRKNNSALLIFLAILAASLFFFSADVPSASADNYADYNVQYVGDPHDADGNPERLLYYNTVYKCCPYGYYVSGCPDGSHYTTEPSCGNANYYGAKCLVSTGVCHPETWVCCVEVDVPIYGCSAYCPYYSWYPIDFRTPYGRNVTSVSPYLYFQNNIVQIENCGNGEGVGGGWVNFLAYDSNGNLARNLGTYGFGEYSGLNAYNLYLGGLPSGSYTMLIQGYIGMNGGAGSPIRYFYHSTYMPFTYQANPTLTVSKSGYGTVTGAGINCGSTCSASYALNTPISLTALASDPNSTFAGWTGNCSGTGACNLVMDSAKSVSASFSCNCSATENASHCQGTTYINSCGNTCSGTQIESDGVCGSATTQSWSNEPTTNLCSYGTASGMAKVGNNWKWTCNGTCGGKNVSCTAKRESNWKEVMP
jgi:hypothetical protein